MRGLLDRLLRKPRLTEAEKEALGKLLARGFEGLNSDELALIESLTDRGVIHRY